MPAGGTDRGAAVNIGVTPLHLTVAGSDQVGHVNREKRQKGRQQSDKSNIHVFSLTVLNLVNSLYNAPLILLE